LLLLQAASKTLKLTTEIHLHFFARYYHYNLIEKLAAEKGGSVYTGVG
jgi:hypothetical protein